jgi:hypothetical protein
MEASTPFSILLDLSVSQHLPAFEPVLHAPQLVMAGLAGFAQQVQRIPGL